MYESLSESQIKREEEIFKVTKYNTSIIKCAIFFLKKRLNISLFEIKVFCKV